MSVLRRRQRFKQHTEQRVLFSGISRTTERPFHFRIHRTLQPILERINVPEPRPFIPDPFQVEALETMERSDVLVTAPTGAGKTYIAVKAIEKVYGNGGRSWYASPLKALSNAKYEEFSQIFGAENVGILTGDRKENVQAPIIVGTTEILRNQLYDTMHQASDLPVDLVVLDEAHYLGDADRGVVWEEVLIYLPTRVRLLLLSATIRNARAICDWLTWMRNTSCSWVSSDERPVPLFPLFLFPAGELSPLSTRRGLYAKIRTVDPKSFPRNNFPDVKRLMEVMRNTNLLPTIFFLKSRSDCEKAISMCGSALGENGRKDSEAFFARLNELLDEFPFLRRHQHLSILKYARVGAHHGGQLPHWKLLLEKLMQDGYLDAIFSTSTVAAGVNFPARTVVVPQSDRFNGKEFLDLTATELLQMTGRAGRRGMDDIGFVLILPGPHQNPQLVHDLLRSSPDAINSQIKINHSMVLNLLLSHTPEEIRTLFALSLATHQNLSEETQVSQEFQTIRKELDQWIPDMACGSLDRLADVRPRFAYFREQLRKVRKIWKKQAATDSFGNLLTPGRIFYSKRGTPYVATHDPDLDARRVEAVRLGFPLRFRKGRIRTFGVSFRRVREVGDLIDILPRWNSRDEWKALATRLASEPPDSKDTKAEPRQNHALDMTNREIASLIAQLASLPCERCALFAPCQKSTSHPFSFLLDRYFAQSEQIHSIQEQLWRVFQRHYRFLQEEGYVDSDGRLTEDGLWASKLRLDQPLLISEGIRKGVFPADDPELLSALIAPFVMDRERSGDHQLPATVWKYQDLAKPFFKMLQDLQPLRDHLNSAGFTTPPMPFWTLVTVYHWARGANWEMVREISGMDEGDLAMVILRTADHLRQIESLAETHPHLAASARKGIELILREPVLIT
ncbi:MAG: DEAD/DEAH box helicase [Syntrophobacteraceae bacterium]